MGVFILFVRQLPAREAEGFIQILMKAGAHSDDFTVPKAVFDALELKLKAARSAPADKPIAG